MLQLNIAYMGKKDEQKIIPFTNEHIKNRNLIIEMLKYEDSLMLSNVVIDYYKNPLTDSRNTLNAFYSTHRLVLDKFGFDTTDDSVNMYRQIFSHYYNSPHDYDKDVINSVVYMRENKCIYYTSPIINVGDMLPNCNVLKLNGIDKISIHEAIGDASYAFVGAFSTS